MTAESEQAVWSSSRLVGLTWAFVAIGVLIRVFRYAMNFPFWQDEAALAANFVSRGYLGLLKPLEFYQVAPPLFLWVEVSAVKIFGFSEYSLRLFPLICGVASMFLIRTIATRMLGPLPALLTVAICAVSPHLIEHSTDVKPYAIDLFVALMMLGLAVDWSHDRSRSRPLWWLAIAASVAISLSHPAVFVAMGIGLSLAIPAWRTARWPVRIGAASAMVAPAFCFVGLFVFVTSQQCAGNGLQGMRDYWADSFPPIGEPLAMIRWLVLTHTGQMFAYPEGGRGGESTGTAILCLVAIATLWRRGSRTILALLLAPFALTFLAACLRRYPYGGEARIVQHLAPMIALMAGLGASVILQALPRPRDSSRGLTLALVGLLLLGCASVGRDWIKPYRGLDEQHAREFARWFWIAQSQDAELACSRSDFGVIEARSQHFATAMYVCYREICRPRSSVAGPRFDFNKVSANHPFRCVVFGKFPLANPPFVVLRDAIVARLPLRSVDTFDFGPPAGPSRMVVTVFEYAPARPSQPSAITTHFTRWVPAEDRVAAKSKPIY